MKHIFRIADGVIFAASACLTGIVLLYPALWVTIPIIASLFVFINIFPSPYNLKFRTARLRVCAEGTDLLISFLIGTVLTVLAHIIASFFLLTGHPVKFAISCAAAALVLAAAFWNGIIRVYTTSVQLGLKIRVIGLLCGFIPIAHLIALAKIISVCGREAEFENDRLILDEGRKEKQICRTKYPILLVHGVFFRDYKFPNYWGRIPDALIKNGAVIYYGNHQSALSVADSGVELTERIRQIVEETQCEKVNVIAHSKGGLDTRYAISRCGADQYIASLTTINTPHRGCLFADYLLKKVPEGMKNSIANTYNAVLRKLGDSHPDFLSAVYDLTDERCGAFNESVTDSDAVYYQSVGSKLNRATDGKFPLNFTYRIAKHFDGPNDGLVSESSFKWGEKYAFLTTEGHRGISHGDVIDLNRENIKGFDVREFYVQLVSNLREKGF